MPDKSSVVLTDRTRSIMSIGVIGLDDTVESGDCGFAAGISATNFVLIDATIHAWLS